MKFLYEGLVQQIRRNIPDLDITVNHILETWPKATMPIDKPNIYLDSVALNLHSFYSGMERLFEMIAKYVDRIIPTGEFWHINLLLQMEQIIDNVRPAVIDHNSAVMLKEFLEFRHVVRNIYTTKLKSDRMQNMLSNLPELWKNISLELLAFADFLDELSDQSE
ncbi:MAG: antitoxin [Candidatus Poribacteria bacterium]